MSSNQEDEPNANDSQEREPHRSQPGGFAALSIHVSQHKIDFALVCTRLGTVIFTLLYLIPLFNVNPYTCYQRALMSNAATSALRLHQRLPDVRLTREFLAQLLVEDSCHYLFYSIIFLNSYPMTLVLLPVALFALLHASSYLITLLNIVEYSNWWGYRFLQSVVLQQRHILRLVAFTEISLIGKMSFIIPFVYYRFITLRYSSRRNPYTKEMFHDLRVFIQYHINKPGFPSSVRNLANKAIEMIGRLEPPTVAQQFNIQNLEFK
uniref:Transmembrane protein 33 n=1 Tax=Strigamia maritima TaxID=126957 RepID=T1IU55_STRMM